MPLLVQAIGHWQIALDSDDTLIVTVDGSREDAERVRAMYPSASPYVFHVGSPERLGVAANKNTGLEILMGKTETERIWLSDDDAWPLSPASLVSHYNLDLPHSMVCWGRNRKSAPVLRDDAPDYASWQWPRGSVLYVERDVVGAVGGMVEEFGHGGHEHVEWSNRIHNAGFTPVRYPSPLSHTEDHNLGAGRLWHCEDMQEPGEPLASLISRRRHLTTVRRSHNDKVRQDLLMSKMRGSTAFIPFTAEANGRVPATLLPVV